MAKEKRERERKIDIDSQKRLWLLRMREKHAFFLGLILTIVMLISRKLVQTSPRNW